MLRIFIFIGNRWLIIGDVFVFWLFLNVFDFELVYDDLVCVRIKLFYKIKVSNIW